MDVGGEGTFGVDTGHFRILVEEVVFLGRCSSDAIARK